MFSTLSRRVFAVTAVVSLAALTGCSAGGTDAASSASNSGAAAEDTTLTVYTDQHAELIEGLTKAYTDETGVKFNIQADATVGQIEAEGKAAPADVFLSEDPGPVAQLGKKDLLSEIDQATLDQIQPGLSSQKKQWAAYAARTRVLYYNPEKIDEAKLPEKLMDINKPEYKGKFAWAPSGAFVATTQYLISTIGEAKTKTFLEGLKENGVNEQKNGNVRDTVEAGKHAMGLSNHYYWWIKADEVGGADKMTSKIHHFPEADAGNLILSSGAAVMKSSEQQEASADFVKWLTAADGGQKLIAEGDIDVSGAQYPVAKDTESKIVGSLDEIKSPEYDMDIMADQAEAENLLKSLGMSS
ncbi:extracellular solute-binding protein [Arthrobacter rhombi]|uniref:extracellular solute-binding protein n=1 Tax=Arthrobacter rhombi TaxID=71253 RepID=UPI003FD17D9F